MPISTIALPSHRPLVKFDLPNYSKSIILIISDILYVNDSKYTEHIIRWATLVILKYYEVSPKIAILNKYEFFLEDV